MRRIRLNHLATIAILSVSLAACEEEVKLAPVCEKIVFDERPFSVCRAAPGAIDLRLVRADETNDIYGQFDEVVRAFPDKQVRFAMNGGMYHDDRSPVGLYIEEGVEQQSIVLREGPGNFGLVPNGVFYFSGRSASVMESRAFHKKTSEIEAPFFATQSGPMLVIDGALHPKFRAESDSRKQRNGVGVAKDGTTYFAISDVPVNFHTFARLFRDELATPNALFLDGVVSKLYAPDLNRNDTGLDMGPIIVAIEPEPKE